MKVLVSILFFSSVLFAGDLTVIIDDIVVDSGTVYIGVFDAEEKFTLAGKEVKRAVVAASKTKISGTFKNIQIGKSYAVFAYQDLNGNGVLDKTKMGKPSEPVAFSNQTKKGFQNYLRSCFIMKDKVSTELMLRRISK